MLPADPPQIELHNVGELSPAGPGPGLRLQRLPETVRLRLDPVGQPVGLCPTHVELRWVAEAEARLTLHSEEHHEYVRVFQGDYFREEQVLAPGETRTFALRADTGLSARCTAAGPAALRGGFAPEVLRVRLSGTGRVRLVGIQTDGCPLRSPRPDEKPPRTLLAYGSSITQGFSAPRLGLPWLTALSRGLGLDYLNLGFGGSCHCEAAMAEHLAAREDWHDALLELGVNLLGARPRVSDEEFRRRAGHLVERVSARSDRRVFVLTPFPSFHDLPGAERSAEPWRQILREIVAGLSRPNLRLVEGPELLDLAGLSADFIHPDDAGHAALAHALAPRLRPLLPH